MANSLAKNHLFPNLASCLYW